MDTRTVQRLLATQGWYRGAIDGDAGPLTWAAVARSEETAGDMSARHWTPARRLIAAGQRVLNALGHEAGAVDGYAGPNTSEALTAWEAKLTGAPVRVDRIPGPHHSVKDAQARWPMQRDMAAFYGPAGGPVCTAGFCRPPLQLRLAWDMNQTIASFRCHAKLGEVLTSIYDQAVRHYGLHGFRDLRLDVFGGCYNYRNMRGGSSLSTHAWGAAVDIDPLNNQLRWGADRASLARDQYDAFWDIVEAHGGTSLGRASNRDWMHFQFARL